MKPFDYIEDKLFGLSDFSLIEIYLWLFIAHCDPSPLWLACFKTVFMCILMQRYYYLTWHCTDLQWLGVINPKGIDGSRGSLDTYCMFSSRSVVTASVNEAFDLWSLQLCRFSWGVCALHEEVQVVSLNCQLRGRHRSLSITPLLCCSSALFAQPWQSLKRLPLIFYLLPLWWLSLQMGLDWTRSYSKTICLMRHCGSPLSCCWQSVRSPCACAQTRHAPAL